MPEPEVPRTASRGRRLALVAAILMGLSAVVAYWVVPIVAETQLIRIVEEETGLVPRVAEVTFDPFRLRLEIAGLALPDRNREAPVLEVEVLVIDARLIGLLGARLLLDEVVLVGPRISAVVDEEGELNLSHLMIDAEGDGSPDDPANALVDAGESDPLLVEIKSFRVARGSVELRDLSQVPAFESRLEPIDLEVDGFTTREGRTSSYTLSLRSEEGTELDGSGTLGIEPRLHSEGDLELSGFDLRLPWKYASNRLRFEVAKGALAVSTHYELDLSDGLSLALREGTIGLSEVTILDRETEEVVLTLPNATAEGIESWIDDRALRSLAIGEVGLEGGSLAMALKPAGKIRLFELFQLEQTGKGAKASQRPNGTGGETIAVREPAGGMASGLAESETAGERSEPEIRVDRFTVEGFELDFEDRSPVDPFAIRLAPLEIEVEGYRNTSTGPIDLKISSGVGEGGHASVSGEVGVDRFAASLAIEAKGIGLAQFEPYLKDLAPIEVKRGVASGKLGVELKQSAAGALEVETRGRVQFDQVQTVDRRFAKDLVGWTSLRVEGLDLASDRIAIEEVVLSGAFAHVFLDEGGESNLGAFFSAAGEAGEADGASGSEGVQSSDGREASPSASGMEKDRSISIGKITLEEVGADFNDYSATPRFEIALGALGGTIVGLSSQEDARAEMGFEGRINEVGPLELSGQINPFSQNPFSDIQIVADGVSLPDFSQYSGRFIGYRIDRGKLRLVMKYRLKDRRLEADNFVSLKQFGFGSRVESEEATSLPVTLAFSVLRDSSGGIDLSFPIEGNLDDPSFSILSLLGKTVVNVITRVATSPLGAVAGLVTSRGDGELASVEFKPGSTVLPDGAEKMIERIADVLVNRPELHLEIRGKADPEVDGPAMRSARIELEIRAMAFEALSPAERAKVTDPSSLELSAADRLKLLERLYAERIGGQATDRIAPERMPVSEPDRIRAVSEAALEALTVQVAEQTDIGQSDLRDLARARATTVQRALLATSEINPDRLFLVDVDVGELAVEGKVPTNLRLGTH